MTVPLLVQQSPGAVLLLAIGLCLMPGNSRAITPEAIDAEFQRKTAKILRCFGEDPLPEKLYTPKPRLAGPHPRLLPAGVTLETLRRRARLPQLAGTVKTIRETADAIAAISDLPPLFRLDIEDPARAWADMLPVLAVAYAIAENPAEKNRRLEDLRAKAELLVQQGPFLANLPLSQSVYSFAFTYDLLFDQLSPELRDTLRCGIVAGVRKSLDPQLDAVRFWRRGHFTANHNYFHYMQLGIAGMVLWGEHPDARDWVNQAVVNFHFASRCHSPDGVAMEGPLYQDYGLRPYLDFAAAADQLLQLHFPLLEDTGYLRNVFVRLHTLLPDRSGFMTYHDGYPRQFGIGAPAYFLAARYRDPRFQLLGDYCRPFTEKVHRDRHGMPSTQSYRTLLWFDPTLSAAAWEELPTEFDGSSYGLYTVRSSWEKSGWFFGLRCGPAGGREFAALLGEYESNGHFCPEQGHFVLYHGRDALLPATVYQRLKLSSNQNTVLLAAPEQPNQWIGQLGGGGPWFRGVYERRNREHPTAHHQRFQQADRVIHAYTCNLGMLYLLNGAKTVVAERRFADVRRVLIFDPAGLLIIADRVRTDHPYWQREQLLLPDHFTYRPVERGFRFSGENGEYLIRDFSPDAARISLRLETVELTTWSDKKRRAFRLESREPVTEQFFIVAIGDPDRIAKLKFQTSREHLVLQGLSAETLQFKWENQP